MATVAELVAELKGRDSGLKSTFDDAEKSAGGLSKAIKNIGTVAAGVVIGVGITKIPGIISGAVGAASDLSESLSKVRIVFGDASGEIEAFASTAAKSMGMSRQAALEATGTFGNFLQAMGLAKAPAAEMSKAMVTLAADLASFNNANPEEVLLALRSGLSGEAEPMRRFGVALSETAVKAKAAQLGLKAVGGELTEQQKIQARYAIIMEQTAMAQGDFARTSTGLANSQRILKAEFADLQANIGNLLLPVFLAFTRVMSDVAIPALTAVSNAIGSLINVASKLANSGIAILVEKFGELKHLFDLGLTGGMIGGEFSMLETAAFNLGRLFRDTLIPAFHDAQEAVHFFMLAFEGGTAGGEISKLNQAMLTLGSAARDVFDFLADHQDVLIGIAAGMGVLAGAVGVATVAIAAMTVAGLGLAVITSPIFLVIAAFAALGAAGYLLIKNWDEIKAKAAEVFNGLPGPIQAALEMALAAVQSFIAGARQYFEGLVEVITGAIRLVVNLVQGDWSGAWDAAKQIVDGALNMIEGAIRTSFMGLGGIILDAVGSMTGAAKQLMSEVWLAMESAAQDFVDIGRRIIEGIINGIAGAVQGLVNAAVNAAKSAYDAAKNALGISSPSKAGIWIGEMFVKGIAQGLEGARDLSVDLPGLGASHSGPGFAVRPQPMAYGGALGAALAGAGAAGGETTIIVELDGETIMRYIDRRQAQTLRLAARGIR